MKAPIMAARMAMITAVPPNSPALIWSYQVHQVWERPVPASITLSPAYQVKVPGIPVRAKLARSRP
jgi:hypothetical protein